MERIIDVYYDRYGYPFKDRELTARFPVAGSEFLGASQTTTIRFHYEQIGTDENVYTVESKRPDGKTGSQLLSKNTTEHYAEMSLSGWYSACKGDLFLSLKVYRGGTTATYNETTQLWEVNGVPVIESTGAIKLAINYTPMGRYENYEDAVETFQQVLAALGDKLDTIKGIVGVSGLSQVDTTEYEEGQLFFDVDTKNIYKLESGSFVKINNKLEIVDVSGQTYQALLDKYGTQPFMSYFEETTNIAIYQFKEITDGYELHCSSQKNGLIHIPSVVLANTFSTSDFTQLDFQSAPVVALNSDIGTLSDFELQQVQQPNATIKYDGEYYTKYFETNNMLGFSHIGVFENGTGGTTGVVLYEIDISLSDGSYRISTPQVLTYTKNKIDKLLTNKQDKLVSGETIKTINGESLLGSGNIVIQGGGGDAEWGSIGGNIADQTDLQNEFQEVREIATGRTRSAIISYLKVAPTEQTFSQRPFYDLRGNRIETWSDFVAFVNGRTFANSKFNSQNDDIEIDYDEYIIFDYHTKQTVYRGDEAEQVDTSSGCLNEGDIIIVKETTDQQGETIPDRWVYISDQTLVCSKLETSKVNLDNYSTKSETSTEVNKVAHDIAVEYNENTLYGVGDLCIKDKLLYKCNTDNTTGTWDSTKWDLTTVNSELGIIKGNYATKDDLETIKLTELHSPLIDSELNAFLNKNIIILNTASYTRIYTPKYFNSTQNTVVGLVFEANSFSNSSISSFTLNVSSKTISSTSEIAFFGSGGSALTNLTKINNKKINYYINNVYPYATNSTTTLQYETINNISISADTTFTLATAPSDTYPEYKANITNSGANDITITLPSGTSIKGNVSISSNTFVIPSGSTVEVNIQNSRAIVILW